VDAKAIAFAHARHGVHAMRSLIASVVILVCAAMLALEVGTAVQASIGKLADSVSLSSRSATK
jgi:hypothetical protein